MSQLAIVVLGCVGGLVPDVLRLVKTRYKKRLPAYLRYLNFWVGVVLLIAIGGLAAWLLAAQDPKDALAYGFAAPELLSRLLATSVKEVDRGEAKFNLREWWAE